MASIFEMFKQAPAAAAPNAAATNQTIPGANNTPVPNPDATAAATGATGTTGDASPLDKFAKLWENDPNTKPDTPFSFNSDPAKLLETARTVDFTKVITPEVMTRIQGGGSEAQKAMIEAMNAVTQNAFAQSAHASAKIVETALQKQDAQFKAALPAIIKQYTVSETVRADNPLMKDPALAPMIGALQSQFTKQYPNASTAEIKNYVNEYLNGAADKIAAQRPQEKVAPTRGEFDWSKFVE